MGKYESEVMKCRFATTCWAIWKERNKTLFLRCPPQIEELISNIMISIEEYVCVNKDQSRTKNELNSLTKTEGVWKRPPSDIMKINVDDSFDPLTRNART
ncbi:hypothetical protein SAY86_000924 [Trapa natans]|uniref:Uncharacterized protein n=1 Tax=Trapa natans TaxID=22666 RepID=A0AAN7MFS8_TRANT|nr:hypothetical protein SAY86_000924 [Trapa natans]